MLDGAVVCGQELRLQLPELPFPDQADTEPVAWDGCVLVPLGAIALELVLLPPMACCSGIATLVRQRQRRALHLRSGYNNPAAWAQSLRANPVEALVSASWRPRLEAAGWALEAVPNAQPIRAEAWLLVHRRDWRKGRQLQDLAGRMGSKLQPQRRDVSNCWGVGLNA